MLLPDDFRAYSKIKVDNHLFNKLVLMLFVIWGCFVCSGICCSVAMPLQKQLYVSNTVTDLIWFCFARKKFITDRNSSVRVNSVNCFCLVGVIKN